MEASPSFDPAVDSPSLENDPALGLSHRAKLEILGAILLGLFLAALDQTIVGPVLPRIVTELQGADLYTWVVTIFLVTSTITVPIYGKLSDLYGRRPLLMFGIIVFLIGSALSGLSQTMWQLILFRGLQGLGAGALFPIALAVIGDLFTPGRARQVPGPLRGRLRDRLPGRSWPGRVPDRHASAGTGSSSSTCRSGSSPWSSSPGCCRTSRAVGGTSRSTTSGVIFLTLGLMPILIGLTLAETSQWSDPAVWGSDRRRLRLPACLHLGRVAGRRADHPAPPVPEPDVQRLDGRDLPGHVRLRRRDHLPAALLPDRRGRQRHRVGLQAPALPRWPDHQRRSARATSSAGPAATRSSWSAGW